jgi:hypothetical protein
MKELGVARYEALGIVASISAFAIEYRPSGELEDELVEMSVEGWVKQEGILLKALVKTGWLDRVRVGLVKIHAWDDITRNYRKVKSDGAKRTEARRAAAAQSLPVDCAVTAKRGEERRGEERSTYTLPSKVTPPIETISHSPPAGAVASHVVGLWNEGRKAPIRVTRLRIAKITARLKDGFSEEQLLAVVSKLKDSGWHNGENDRGWRAPGPEWVLHTTERVESWLEKEATSLRQIPMGLMAEVRKKFLEEKKEETAGA